MAIRSRSELPYRVECKSIYPFFEVIAAFNSGQVALQYAEDCRQGKPSEYEYRVMFRGKEMPR